jgi:hypothetical protein
LSGGDNGQGRYDIFIEMDGGSQAVCEG